MPACAVRPLHGRVHAPAPSGRASAFLRAVESGDAGEVARMLAADASLASTRDAEGRSAFVLAHLAGRPQIAAILRGTGLELDLVEAVLAEDWERFSKLAEQDPAACNAAHPVGGTPLYAAALVGSLDMWRLRAAGCLPDAAPAGGSGFTPARGAMQARTVSAARIAATDLLANGGDANAPQRVGDSVLHGAVRRQSLDLVRLAIRKHGSPDARDADGRTPRELAVELGWRQGADLLAREAELPRDHRASRFLYDAHRQPIERPDLSDVPRALQSEVTGSSHMRLARVRELVGKDRRLVFSISTDDELAIEASAHMGNRPLIRFHLDHGAPLSLPTAVALGDRDAIAFLLAEEPRLVNERGAHDFPVMHYAVFGGSIEIAEQIVDLGVSVDQESMGSTALHWCVMRGEPDLARWLIEKGADVDAIGFKWSSAGHTPLQLAKERDQESVRGVLETAGATG